MVNHLDFLQAFTNYHENLRLTFYPKIFENNPADVIDWKNHQAKFHSSKQDFSWMYLTFPTLLITLIIASFGLLNFRKL